MITTRCDKFKDKAVRWSCDECQSKPLSCFVCNEIITYRERDIIIWLNIIMIQINI